MGEEKKVITARLVLVRIRGCKYTLKPQHGDMYYSLMYMYTCGDGGIARMMALGRYIHVHVQAIRHSVLHPVADSLGGEAIQLVGRRGDSTCN